jgi:PKD repeat protein
MAAPQTSELEASRTSGVAPLAVFFDATGNDLSTQAFHERGYVWDFGDPSSGTWATTGRSKNAARGPFAAHTFETPGTYTVTAVVTDMRGSSRKRTATISVEDPDVVFAGKKTVCFSTGRDFSGCPSGAKKVTLNAFHEALTRAKSGMRLLFKRGDIFSGVSRADLDAPGPGILGAFGSGDPPAIDMTYSDGLLGLSDSRPTIDDWRIMDLHFIGHGSGFIIEAENRIQRVTMLRLSTSNAAQSVVISTSKPDYFGNPIHSEVALLECSFHDMVGGYGAFVSSEKLMVLGNRIVDVNGHVFRTQHVKRGVYSNNLLSHPNKKTGTVLKLHAEPVRGVQDGPRRASSHFVITGNIFEGAGNDWSVSIGPQSHRWNESVHDGILDGNHFIAGSGSQVLLHLAGTKITVRNNLFDTSAALEHIAIHVARRGIEPPPNKNFVYNNTCFTSAPGDTATCVLVAPDASRTRVHNNLLVAAAARRKRALDDKGSSTDAGANLALEAATLKSSSPKKALDFALSATNEAVDAGLPTGASQVDFRGTARNTDGDGDGTAGPDVGAFEFPGPG